MSNETTLDDVLALVAKATPGSWHYIGTTLGEDSGWFVRVAPHRHVSVEGRNGKEAEANARLIAAVVNYLRAHCDELRAALEDARRWRHARKLLTVDDIEGMHGAWESFGRLTSEEECARADAAIDAAQEGA